MNKIWCEICETFVGIGRKKIGKGCHKTVQACQCTEVSKNLPQAPYEVGNWQWKEVETKAVSVD